MALKDWKKVKDDVKGMFIQYRNRHNPKLKVTMKFNSYHKNYEIFAEDETGEISSTSVGTAQDAMSALADKLDYYADGNTK